jgi:hypothetical protein
MTDRMYELRDSNDANDDSDGGAPRDRHRGLRRDGRQVALELRRLVHGDLAGMFDGETSPGVELGAGMARPVPALRLRGPRAAHGCALSLGSRAPWRAVRPSVLSCCTRVGRPQPPGHGSLATGDLQTVACLRGGQRGCCAPPVGSEGLRPGRLPARAAGRRVAGRRRDPCGVRPGDRGSRSGGGELWACPGPSR